MNPDGREGNWDSEDGQHNTENGCVATDEPLAEEDASVSTSELCLVEDGREATGGPLAAWEGPEERLARFREGSLVEAA